MTRRARALLAALCLLPGEGARAAVLCAGAPAMAGATVAAATPAPAGATAHANAMPHAHAAMATPDHAGHDAPAPDVDQPTEHAPAHHGGTAACAFMAACASANVIVSLPLASGDAGPLPSAPAPQDDRAPRSTPGAPEPPPPRVA